MTGQAWRQFLHNVAYFAFAVALIVIVMMILFK